MYVRLGELSEARKVFDKMPKRSVISWTAMINGYVSFSLQGEALRFFSEENGIVENSSNYVCLLNLCCKTLYFDLAL